MPGEFPFLRGNQATGYRGRYWTFRMFSGMGSAKDTNTRWHMLLKQGQTGLSTAFDFPTLMGYDSDSPKARGECGRCGVAIDTLDDFLTLMKGIPMDRVTTSMTINPPATALWAMYCAAAESKGVPLSKIGGTIQNDMLKEFIAQKTFMCPPEPSVRLISDTVEFGTKHVPNWNTISISGYHIREAGSTAIQELAFTLRDGIEYVEDVIRRKGLDVDEFAPRLSFFFNAHIDFFEEICKMRAARRIWARVMRDRFHAKNPRSWWMRFHTQTAGCSLTAQQPYNNVVRTAVEALAAVLGGTQSLHTNSLDEVLCLPSDHAVEIALRTQQILAEETGVANTIDPLAGSYFVESLTNKMEEEAWAYIEKIDAMGGMIAAIEKGFPQLEIADAAYRFQQQIDAGEKVDGRREQIRHQRKAGDPRPGHQRAGRGGADRPPGRREAEARLPRREAGPRRVEKRLQNGEERHALLHPGGEGPRHGAGDLRRLPGGLRRIPRPRPLLEKGDSSRLFSFLTPCALRKGLPCERENSY